MAEFNAFSSRKRKIVPDFKVDSFNYGLLTKIKDAKTLPPGAPSDSLNWLTRGDRIELRRGFALLGQTRQVGAGKITGLCVGQKADGTQIPYYTHGRKVKYYSAAADDAVEIGVDSLPAAADGEDIALENYHNLAGVFVIVSSKNSSIYKIVTANGEIVDQSSSTFRGKIKLKKGRTFLWDRKDSTGGRDMTSLYGSYIDKDELSDYTVVTGEVLGASGATTYAGILAFKGAGPKRTCMHLSVTGTTGAGAETLTDDGNGVLSSPAGGVGTINYATGAYSVTFSAVTVSGNITGDYYWEDATNTSAGTSTSGAYLDFSKSTPRTAAQGFVVPQPDDGPFQNLFFINDIAFCFHSSLTYKLTLTKDDTNATNEIYRTKVGLPYWLAGCETGDGIPYVDATDQNNPEVRVLGFAANSQEIVPLSLSANIDLSDYVFDQAVLMEWGEYLILACRSSDQPANNAMFSRLKSKGYWDLLDFPASRLGIYNGALIGGDSLSNNLYTFFSGVDDDGSEILNHWTGAESNLRVDGLKRCMIFAIDGLIGPDQVMKVSFNLDGGGFYEVRDPDRPTEYAVQGDGPYVDRSQPVHIGGPVMGSTEIGGGGVDGDIPAYHFRREFVVATDLFEYVQPKFEGLGIGWLQINSYKFKDLRYKGRRQALRYAT